MGKKPHGILKHRPHGSSFGSSDNLLASTSFIPLTTMPSDETMVDKERYEKHRGKEKSRDEDDDFVNVAIEDTNKPTQKPAKSRNKGKVQFPDDLPMSPPTRPYYARQDSDTMSVRSSRTSMFSNGDDSGDDYDWSDEEDLLDEQAKFSKSFNSTYENKGWGPRRILSLLLSSLIGSTILAVVLITPALLVHFYWYKPHPTEHRRYVRDNVQAWLFWVAANLVISWGLAMIIDIVPIFLRYFISATWGHVSESVKTRIETYDSVKNTAKPAFYAGSAFASWVIIFNNIYELYNSGDTSKSRAQYTNRMREVVEFFFFLILLLRIQAMISHFIAFSFHQVAYKERIEEVERSLVVIEKLRQYRPKHQPRPPSYPQPPRPRSGGHTPLSGASSPPLTNKQHFSLLSNALRKAKEENSDVERSGGSDQEDSGRRALSPSAVLNRLSWQNSEGLTYPPAAQVRAPSPLLEMETLTTVTAPGLSEGTAVALERLPSSPSLGQVYAAAPEAPSHLKTSSYPPPPQPMYAGSPRRSLDDPFYAPSAGNTASGTASPGGLVNAAEAAVAGAAVAAEAAEATLRQTVKVLKSAVLHDARNIKGGTGDSSALGWNVNSAHEAKRLARSIFMRFQARGRSWLVPADFYPAFPTASGEPDKEAAEAAFKVLDKDANGDLSRAEIKTALLKIYKERRFLSRSMRDVGEALKMLDRILLVFALGAVFFISLSVFGVQVGTSLTSVYTVVIAASFIFKASASSAFDAIMFLFVTHPYDTGDRVLINDQNLVVKKVGLFATVFSRADGTETYYFNSQLFNQFILNMRRSDKTWENLTMQVAWTTPLTKLDALERRLNDWLSTEENRWYEPSTNIMLRDISFQRYLEITIGIGHNGNWQDWGLHNTRRTAFHAAVHYYCRQLGIVGYEAPLPIAYVTDLEKFGRGGSPSSGAVGQFVDDPQPPQSPQPASPTPTSMQEDVAEVERVAKEMKPVLGFLPPMADRSSHMLRARKSRNRKANIGASAGS
ncbi:hypothetical protein BDN70DRAFT_991464 [Pholiota conissans]|uniref:EF-hand domain-containing protein n=1 Tax=Pholiota conissans TaxID=109636 RepID=A0A9P6CWK6_9AGAR|nr:hypothetical protein BDN70DRAFT_991464 [Pholiota conissans]